MNPTGLPFEQPPAQPATSGSKEAVNVPAILIMVMAGIGVLTTLIGLIARNPEQVQESMSQLDKVINDPNMAGMRSFFQALKSMSEFSVKYGVVLNLVSLVIDGVMLYGAFQMRQLKSWGLALAAAILVMLPLGGCCCALGLPVGIWAVVVLMRADVKADFT